METKVAKMSKFNVLFLTEIKKIISSKAFKVVFILLILFTLLLSVSVEILYSINDLGILVEPPAVFEDAKTGYQYYTELVEKLESNYKQNNEKPQLNDKTLHQLKSNQAYYKYLMDNNLTSAEALPYSSGMTSMRDKGIGYIRTIIPMASGILILFAITIASTNMVGEMSNGNMKLILIRPVNRNAVFTAKWVAAFTVCSVMLLAELILVMTYSAIRFNLSSNFSVLIYNTSKAFAVNNMSLLIIEFFIGIFTMFAFLQLSYFIGSISRSKTGTLAFPILIYVFGKLIDQLFGFMFIGYIGFSVNLDILSNFTLTGNLFNGMNIYTCIIISFLYIAFFMFTNYYTFNKRDIN